LEESPVEVNAYYWFSAIFDYLLVGLAEYPELHDCLYDILMHCLAELNTHEGICKDEFCGRFLKDDVKSGKFGGQFNDVFDTFERRHTRFVIESMVRLYGLGASVTLFRSVMRQIYPYMVKGAVKEVFDLFLSDLAYKHCCMLEMGTDQYDIYM